jgi:Flp pilus assembly protein TadG
MTIDRRARRSGEGQILVIFALALVAIMAMVGLVLDGGSAFAMRRNVQNVADMAALAAANDYLLNNSIDAATARARSVASSNGFTHGDIGTSVAVTITTTNGVQATVAITAPHRNSFASVVGMGTWSIGANATALAGFPDTALGANPFIFAASVFGTNGQPQSQYADSAHPFAFGEGNGDVPNNANDFAWTNYGTGNVSTSEVSSIIQGSLVINKTLTFGDYIGQHNNGNHTALYGDVQTYLAGKDVPVPVVDVNGYFQGWSTFHIASASGGSTKTVTGYFLTDFTTPNLTVSTCAAGSCPRYLGTYVLKLVD